MTVTGSPMSIFSPIGSLPPNSFTADSLINATGGDFGAVRRVEVAASEQADARRLRDSRARSS